MTRTREQVEREVVEETIRKLDLPPRVKMTERGQRWWWRVLTALGHWLARRY